MRNFVYAPFVVLLALLLIAVVSLSSHGDVRAEPVPYATPPSPRLTPLADSAGLLGLVPTRTPSPIPAPVQNIVVLPAATAVPYRAPNTAPPLPSVCGLTGPEYHQPGGQTIVIGAIAGAPVGQEGGFVFDLPPGDYVVARILRNNVTTVQVCYLQDASTLVLTRENGVEVSRSAHSFEAAQAFDALIASIRPPTCVFECGHPDIPVP